MWVLLSRWLIEEQFFIPEGMHKPSSRENSHQLLEWLEWRSFVEDKIHALNVLEVESERSKVMREIPLPRRSLEINQSMEAHRAGALTYALVVVMQHPGHAFNVALGQPAFDEYAVKIDQEQERTPCGTRHRLVLHQTSVGSSAPDNQVPRAEPCPLGRQCHLRSP
jgi:hypothetical protein